MNFSEIELYEIARLIKEEEGNIAHLLQSHLSNTEETIKMLEELRLYYARKEKQKKREQRICNYIDNEETLAYLKENFADIFSFSSKANGSPSVIIDNWQKHHQKVIEFFESLRSASEDTDLVTDIDDILTHEKDWHQKLLSLSTK